MHSRYVLPSEHRDDVRLLRACIVEHDDLHCRTWSSATIAIAAWTGATGRWRNPWSCLRQRCALAPGERPSFDRAYTVLTTLSRAEQEVQPRSRVEHHDEQQR